MQEPKNALVKQYKKLLEYDDVDLEFTEDALNAIADKAIERNIGARGLRAVMEGLLTKVMYEIPSDETVVKAVVTKECVEGTAEPELTHDPNIFVVWQFKISLRFLYLYSTTSLNAFRGLFGGASFAAPTATIPVSWLSVPINSISSL